MKIIDTTLWWTGAAVWGFVAGFALYLILEVIRAFVASISWHRWAVLEVRRRGVKFPIVKLPRSFFVMWWELLGHRPGNQKWTTRLCAEWRGIGDWNLGTALKVPGGE